MHKQLPVGSQTFGYQILFCTRLITLLWAHKQFATRVHTFFYVLNAAGDFNVVFSGQSSWKEIRALAGRMEQRLYCVHSVVPACRRHRHTPAQGDSYGGIPTGAFYGKFWILSWLLLYFEGLLQDFSNSSVLAMELQQSCTKHWFSGLQIF